MGTQLYTPKKTSLQPKKRKTLVRVAGSRDVLCVELTSRYHLSWHKIHWNIHIRHGEVLDNLDREFWHFSLDTVEYYYCSVTYY